MKKVKILGLVALIGVSTIGVSIIAVNTTSNLEAEISHKDEVFHHYIGRNPTSSSIGCRSYYICCEHRYISIDIPSEYKEIVEEGEVSSSTMTYLESHPEDIRYLASNINMEYFLFNEYLSGHLEVKLSLEGISSIEGQVKIPTYYNDKLVDRVASSGFKDASNITRVVIHDKVEKIESNAFEGCSSLDKIFLPKSVTNVQPYAFKNCNASMEIYVEASSKPSGYYDFLGDHLWNVNNYTVHYGATRDQVEN